MYQCMTMTTDVQLIFQSRCSYNLLIQYKKLLSSKIFKNGLLCLSLM